MSGNGHGHNGGQAKPSACMGRSDPLVPDLSGSQESLQHSGSDAVPQNSGRIQGGSKFALSSEVILG